MSPPARSCAWIARRTRDEVTGRYDAWRERAFDYAWVLDVAGLA
jgi:hypothetical protein